MPNIQDIIAHLETTAPPSYQESYDNAGLITGTAAAAATGAIICLDATEAVIGEAIAKGCNLVVAHHPIVFRGLKRLTGKNYVERTVIKAIKNDVAIYAIHTNLDNVYHQGVNAKIAEKLGLKNTRILAPKKALKKLVVLVPEIAVSPLRAALFEAGAGRVNGQSEVSFAALGAGTTDGGISAIFKLEVVYPSGNEGTVLEALHTHAPGAHYEVSTIENHSLEVGSGYIGELTKAVDEEAFLAQLKKTMKAGVVRHTGLLGHPVKTVALCGGAGSFLLPQAIAQKADIFITGDFKYHEFFDAGGKIVIADIGHYESEQFTIELLRDIIAEKFPTFALHLTKVNTNPVHYL
ncbi:MAG: Nif3-like dinuclear metal center hexameric protein [Saprospiraceae bacterium]